MSLGKDLASIRESQNLTLEEVQKAIKIPLLTLKSIENDSIFSDDADNKTYRRSFVRSYAKLLRLDDENVVRALDAMEAGKYRSEYLTGVEPTGPEEKSVPEDENIEEPEEPITPPPVNAPQVEPKPNTPPTINTVNWADMGRKFNTVSKGSKTWIVLVSFILVVLIGGGAYLFSEQLTGLFESDPSENLVMENNDPMPALTDTTDSTQPTSVAEPDISESGETEELPPQPITLGDTLTITVYAAYGQLEPIRVTSDYNWRTNPFWMEEGEAYNFDFQDTILVRGQYSRLLLLFNGHPIENPLQNHFNPAENSIMITRSDLNNPKYLAPPPEEFPLEVGPPDSIVYRLRL